MRASNVQCRSVGVFRSGSSRAATRARGTGGLFYYGKGNRIEESVRAFGYHNQDLSFIKNTKMAGTTNFQIRCEVFNF